MPHAGPMKLSSILTVQMHNLKIGPVQQFSLNEQQIHTFFAV